MSAIDTKFAIDANEAVEFLYDRYQEKFEEYLHLKSTDQLDSNQKETDPIRINDETISELDKRLDYYFEVHSKNDVELQEQALELIKDKFADLSKIGDSDPDRMVSYFEDSKYREEFISYLENPDGYKQNPEQNQELEQNMEDKQRDRSKGWER